MPDKIHSDISYRRLLLDKRDLNLNSQVTQQKLESVGTIRNLTIMFCDIKGFTPFSESLSAYDVIFILNRYFSIMREVIIQNSGEINNYIGDAVMAIFGLKESRQQTLRATNAAIQMLEAMDEFKLYLNKAYGRDFDIRIGIHFDDKRDRAAVWQSTGCSTAFPECARIFGWSYWMTMSVALVWFVRIAAEQ